MTKTDRPIVFWDCQDSETLRYETKDEAIEYFLDDLLWDAIPKKIEVKGYARRVAVPGMLSPLDYVLEYLDEELGDPDGNLVTPTERMKKAEQEFIKVILEEYEPWACEPVVTEEVDTMAWIKEHRPDWLEGKK